MLQELAETGLFVFHGSDNPDIEELEPRQAYDKGKPDGQPAVCAAINPDLTIFKSLMPKFSAGWTRINGEMLLLLKEKGDEEMKDKKGFVYILDKVLFSPDCNETGDWRAYKEIKPISKVKVGINDAPPFQVLSEEEYVKFWKERRKALKKEK
ncbi:MAG: hypothetical protein M1355_00290 [Patescibacteria group bacterium]|nr:hypothetical protein [Patescibacteria group bacterium]